MPSQVANFSMCHPLRFWAPANGWQAWLSLIYLIYIYIYHSSFIIHLIGWYLAWPTVYSVFKSRPTSTMVISCRERDLASSQRFPSMFESEPSNSNRHVWGKTVILLGTSVASGGFSTSMYKFTRGHHTTILQMNLARWLSSHLRRA